MEKKYGENNIIKYIGIVLLSGAMLLPMAASAASVTVYPTITNAHGGTKYAKDITTCIIQGSYKDCQTGVPTYQIGAGDFAVSISAPAGYAYSFTGDGMCSGTLTADQDVTCYVDYTDGALIQEAPAPAPQPASVPQNAPVSGGVSVPIPTGIPMPAAAPEATTSDTTPAPQTILKVVVIHDYATTSPELASTSAAVQDLQTRVGLLEQIVQTLQNLIGKIINLLGL